MPPREKKEGLLQTSDREGPVAKHPGPNKNHFVVARLGEQAAIDWLENTGYTILDRNWHSGRHGEIDIVARDAKHLLTFIEVKTRRLAGSPGKTKESGAAGSDSAMRRTADSDSDFQARTQAFESLNWRKQRKIISAALSYIAYNKISDPSCQLDAIVITFTQLSRTEDSPTLLGVYLLHVPRAFSAL